MIANVKLKGAFFMYNYNPLDSYLHTNSFDFWKSTCQQDGDAFICPQSTRPSSDYNCTNLDGYPLRQRCSKPSQGAVFANAVLRGLLGF
jgi:hypothetical protein